jgi:hypothetical protein
MESYWYKPAFYAHIVSSIAMVIALVLFVVNFKKLMRMDTLELIKICSLVAIAVASHAQGHISLEKEYGYDPLGNLLR